MNFGLSASQNMKITEKPSRHRGGGFVSVARSTIRMRLMLAVGIDWRYVKYRNHDVDQRY